MKLRMAIATAAGVAALGAGALAVPAAIASPATAAAHTARTHTLSFISVTKKSVMFTRKTGAQQDTDVNRAGKVVGFDLLYFKVTSASSGILKLTVDASGGFVYGTADLNLKTSQITHGTVTGGTGAFRGATGTLAAKSLNGAGSRTAITMTYHS